MAGYARYLRLDSLLDLQQPRSDQPHGETTFIIGHQIQELLFKLVVADLELAVELTVSDRLDTAAERVERVVVMEKLLADNLEIVEQLDEHVFTAIRPMLAGASGAESRQYHRIEALSTCWTPGRSRDGDTDLWTAFCCAGERSGLPMPCGSATREAGIRRRSLARLYRERGRGRPALLRLARRLIDHDRAFAQWRYRHALLAFQFIGQQPGTGGSAGASYLEARLRRRFYPELWGAALDRPEDAR